MSGQSSYQDLIEEIRADTRELVTVERRGRVATVVMNDPKRLNALSGPLSYQLRERLGQLASDAETRVVILTGADPAFSAGGDVALMTRAHQWLGGAGTGDGTVNLWRWIRYQFGGVARILTQTDKTYIAAINGPAAGVGLAFALACDLLIASERARLLTAFGRIGLVPEVGTSWLLTRRVGYHRAFELYVSGRELSGREAVEIGLVNGVVPHEDLLAQAHAYAERVLALPEALTALTKPLLRSAADMTWEQAIAMEEFAEPMCFTTTGHQEAVRRFLEAHGWRP